MIKMKDRFSTVEGKNNQMVTLSLLALSSVDSDRQERPDSSPKLGLIFGDAYLILDSSTI